MPRKKSRTPDETWTLKELKEYIRSASKKAEDVMRSFEELIDKPKQAWRVRKGFNELRKKAGRRARGDNDLPLGLNKGKKALIEQAKGLYNFNRRKTTKQVRQSHAEQTKFRQKHEARRAEADGLYETEPQSQPVSRQIRPEDYPFPDWWEEDTKRAYKSFVNNHGYITPGEYHDLMETFGEVKEFLQTFGYEDSKANVDDFVNNMIDYNQGTKDNKAYSRGEMLEAMRAVSQMAKSEKLTMQQSLIRLDAYLDEHFNKS